MADEIDTAEPPQAAIYNIGKLTESLVFRRNNIENVADMQIVFDAVESALASMASTQIDLERLQRLLRLEARADARFPV